MVAGSRGMYILCSFPQHKYNRFVSEPRYTVTQINTYVIYKPSASDINFSEYSVEFWSEK